MPRDRWELTGGLCLSQSCRNTQDDGNSNSVWASMIPGSMNGVLQSINLVIKCFCLQETHTISTHISLPKFSSVAQLCPTLCNPMDCSMPGLPVHHQLPKLAQTHVHRVNDAIQLSHPLSSPSPPAFSLSQHQGFFLMSQFFASGSQSIGVSVSASVLPMNIQDWFPLGWTDLISLQSKGLSSVFFSTTVQKHQFFSAQLSLWYNAHTHTWLLEKP